jgi:hypothetical protein
MLRHEVIASLRRVLLVASTLAAFGCATLPPAQAARDLKAIAGRWEGTVRLRDGAMYKAKMEITEDGRYVAVLDPPIRNLGATFPGTIKVENGQFVSFSEVTRATGTFTLHEGDGKRVLTSSSSNATGEYVPARP